MRTVRTHWKTYALGVTAVAALLSSTACRSDGGGDGKSPTPSGSPSATRTPAPSGTPGTAGTAKPGGGTPGTSRSPSSGTGGSGGSGGSGGGKDAATACNDNDLSIALSTYRQDSGQHLLITATNMTDKACTLYHYPRVGFGATIEGPLPTVGPKAQAIATIGPKEKAYAGLFVFRPGEDTVTVTAVSMGYQDRAFDSNRDVGMLDHAVPKDVVSLTVGSNPRVTYWNRDLKTVEDLLFRSGNS